MSMWSLGCNFTNKSVAGAPYSKLQLQSVTQWCGFWRGADLHMVQLMPLPLTASCFSEIQIAFTFLVTAHLGSPGQRAVNGCVLLREVALFL